MKKKLATLILICLTYSGFAQTNLSTNDSISTFYSSLISVMKKDFLYKDKVNWMQVESELKDSLKSYNDFKSSLNQITTLFDRTNATHCSVYFGENGYAASYNGPTEKDFSAQWLTKYVSEPQFEVKVLDRKYGYILIPAINFEDISSENIHNISQPLYDEINQIKSANSLKGWIIDLRFNSGGNIYPMLLALYDFLGDNSVYGTMDIDKKIISMAKLEMGKYLDNDSITSYIIPKGVKLTKTKVAIITGIATASSGEITAMAFKGRGNTTFIGEKTMGMTTTNDFRELPFEAYMALTIGYDCDRNGNFYEKIIPDVEISKEDDFDNLMNDKNIEQAIKFIEGK